MRAWCWISMGGVALACGGSTAKPHADATVGGAAGVTAGAATNATGGAGPSQGGSAVPGAGSSLGGSAGLAGTTDVGDAAGEAATSGAAGEAGSPPTFDATCPSTLPARRGGCTDGLTCDYGDDLRTSCRPRAYCEAGRWQIEKPDCPLAPSCEKIPGFEEEKPCVATEQPSPCKNESAHLCNCWSSAQGARWRCGHDLAASSCPQQSPPNVGQPCTFGGLPDFELDCYYNLCPGGQHPHTVVSCGLEGWHTKETCSFD